MITKKILLVPALAVMLLVGCSETTTTETEVDTGTDMQTPVVSDFDFTVVKEGDKLGDWEVLSVSPDTNEITFFSEVENEITGSFEYYDKDSDFWPNTGCMVIEDEASLAKLPSANWFGTESRTICFMNNPDVRESIGTEAKDSVTTTIYGGYTMNVMNGGDMVDWTEIWLF